MASNKISPEEVNARVLAGEPMVFVDARKTESWAKSNRKIPGAVRAPADKLESHLKEIDKSATVIAYCTSPDEESSLEAAQALREAGYRRVFALRGGFNAWAAAGYPMEEKAAKAA